MNYAFILGKNTALSVAEIISVLKRESFVFVILSISLKTLIIKLDKKIENPQDFLNRIGGTIKIAEILLEIQEKALKESILEYISNSFSEAKFVFGLSFYGLNNKNLGFEIKKELKSVGINSRLIKGKEDALSAPEIKNNKIIDKGADFVLIKNQNKVFMGKTIAIQDYESYSHRDYDRPRRNAKSGMLPPKVAQIMINLIPSEPKKLKSYLPNKLIYDPFCGQGTILQEALLMDYQVIGSDISPNRIFDAKQNLKWVAREYDLKVELEKIVFQADALNLGKECFSIQPDAIVSEVYLGPPMTGHKNINEIEEVINDLEKKYSNMLKKFKFQISNFKFAIFALPFYKTKNGYHYLNIIDGIEKNGYNVISPLKDGTVDLRLIPEYNSRRRTILYSRSDQIVGREIIILSKKID